MIYVIYSFLSTFNQSHSVDTYYIYHYWLWCARVCLDRSPPAEISISPFSRQRQRRASYKSASFLLNDPFYQKSAQPILHLSYSLVWVYFRSCSVSWRWLERYESNFWTVSCSPTAQIVGITGFPPYSITLLIETATLKRTRWLTTTTTCATFCRVTDGWLDLSVQRQ